MVQLRVLVMIVGLAAAGAQEKGELRLYNGYLEEHGKVRSDDGVESVNRPIDQRDKIRSVI